MSAIGLSRSPSESWLAAALRRAQPNLVHQVQASYDALRAQGVAEDEAATSAVIALGCAEGGRGG